MIFLGNPEYGVDLFPIDFVKVAEGCGLKAVHIEDPRNCRDQLRQALAMPGPVVIEAVVDPHEPPAPPKIKREQTVHLAEALARGDVNRRPVGLSIGHDMIDESTFAASPYGLLGKLGVGRSNGGRKPEPERKEVRRGHGPKVRR